MRVLLTFDNIMCYMCIDGVYNSCVQSLYIRSVKNPIFTHYTLVPLTIENGLVIHCIKLLTVTDYCLHYISKLIIVFSVVYAPCTLKLFTYFLMVLSI